MQRANPTAGRRPRFTIGALMLAILAVALILGVIRPVAGILTPIYPDIARMLQRLATIEMGFVCAGVLITIFAIVRLMAEDEKG